MHDPIHSSPFPRPGENAYVSPEGIIYGTDGKCRWVCDVPRLLGPLLGSPRCLLFTMDETSISSCQVKGRIHKDEVIHAFAVWVGGQSQPALRFQAPRTVRLSAVKRITPSPAKHLIRLSTGLSGFSIHADPRQFSFILDHLTRYCPQAKRSNQ